MTLRSSISDESIESDCEDNEYEKDTSPDNWTKPAHIYAI